MARGAFVGYLVSRTVGLLGLTEAELFESMRIASLVVKGLFVVLYPAERSLFGDRCQRGEACKGASWSQGRRRPPPPSPSASCSTRRSAAKQSAGLAKMHETKGSARRRSTWALSCFRSSYCSRSRSPGTCCLQASPWPIAPPPTRNGPASNRRTMGSILCRVRHRMATERSPSGRVSVGVRTGSTSYSG